MLFISFVSCKNNKQEQLKDGFIIDGKLSNAAGKKIILQRLTVKERISIDSAIISKDGTFSFTVKPTEIGIYLLMKDADTFITLISDKGEHIQFDGDWDIFNKNYTVKGSSASEQMAAFNKHLQKNLSILDSLGKLWNDAKYDANRLAIKASIDTTYFRTVRDQREFQLDFINKNSSSLAGMLALYVGLDRTLIITEREDFKLFEKLSTDLSAKYPTNTQVVEFAKRIKQKKMLMLENKLTNERNSKK